MRGIHIQILYFSGAGATKYVALLMNDHLSQYAKTGICSFEQMETMNWERADGLIVGTPVYHAAPALQVMEYFASIPPIAKPVPVFLYNIRGLYSCNTNRILAKKLAEKGILTVQDAAYRGPASDGALIMPFFKRFFQFEPGIESKVHRDCARFVKVLERGDWRPYTPRFHLGSILNAPNKWAGQLITFPIHLHTERCSRCMRCCENCPRSAVRIGETGYPAVLTKRCENCYRCIHHCPNRALSLSKRRAPQKVLYRP